MIGLELDFLKGFLDDRCPGLVNGELTGEMITGGKSNLTYRVSDGRRSWIVRRPPLGHVLATAHDMAREYKVINALSGTGVPVPKAIAISEDPSFYVMENVPGTIYRTGAQAEVLGLSRLERIATSLMEVLAALHAVNPAEVGLSDFGRPDGYLERQLRRWGKQLESSRSRPLEGIDELHSLLSKNIPQATLVGIVHGDYRLDNVIIRRDDTVAAVLDWEMATLGDQLSDLGLLLMYWELLITGGGLFGPVTDPGHFPSTHRLIQLYAKASGADLSRLNWYTAFANFKLAVIAEGIHYRYLAGQTVGEGFATIGEGVQPLVNRGLSLLEED